MSGRNGQSHNRKPASSNFEKEPMTPTANPRTATIPLPRAGTDNTTPETKELQATAGDLAANLPSTLAATLELACNDAETVFNSDPADGGSRGLHAVPNGDMWLARTFDGTCVACLAGAVVLTHTDPDVVRSYGYDGLGMLRDHQNNAVAVGKPARLKIESINDARMLDFRSALLTFYGIDSLPPGTEDQLRNLREVAVDELADGDPPAGVEQAIAMKDRNAASRLVRALRNAIPRLLEIERQAGLYYTTRGTHAHM